MGIITVPDFLKNATNVYRTRGYIVKQHIMYKDDVRLGTYLFSCDTYYRCTENVTGNTKKRSQTGSASTASVFRQWPMCASM